MTTPNLTRFEQFLAIPVEDIEARSQFALSQSEKDELHTLAVNGQVSWDLYHQVANALTADLISKNRDWTVAYIREQLGRTIYRHYSRGDEEIHEWISGRLFPKAEHIERIRSQKGPLHIIQEVELALWPETDLEELWNRVRPGLEEEGIELLQKFPDNQFVQDMCFLPGEQNMEVRFVISAGPRRKELKFPIALRYKPLLKAAEKKYALDDTGPDDTKAPPASGQPLQRASTEEQQEALTGLFRAAKTYDKKKGSMPAHMKKQTLWHMGEQFKERSKERVDPNTGAVLVNPKTGKPLRVLRAELDREGGSLDDPVEGKDGTELETLGDTIADPQSRAPDQRILLQQIFDSLFDETDQKIVHLYLEGQTQKEIAKKLEITQPAIARRLKRMGRRLSR